MPSAKALIGSFLGSLFLRDARVHEVHDPAPGYRIVTIHAEDLCDRTHAASEKVQIFLPGVGMRTYTPIDHNAALGRMSLFTFVHGGGPGSEWARTVKKDDTFRFFGPRRSISFAELSATPIVFFGDETSLATIRAVASERRTEDGVAAVCEARDKGAAEAVLRGPLGLVGPEVIQKLDGGAHLDAVVARLASMVEARPGARLVLTGCSESIVHVRRGLASRGITAIGKVKPYWAPGRVGLD
ncbi:MAG: siderophore-interacting protein [Polyangiaceae bacterium]